MKYLITVLIFCLLVSSAFAEPPETDPANQPDSAPLMAAPIRFFQKYLSGADGHRCPMIPSCSTYALQAMKRHGAIQGWIMASDRLMRCGRDELKHSPSVMTRYGIRYRDPVENNDFWLH
jgi:putative component of membrane protein insertase Oxa1/YidC/SpoIIIJ protein YidD